MVFSPTSNDSGSAAKTLSPALSFSIASQPAVVRINVPATKHAIF